MRRALVVFVLGSAVVAECQTPAVEAHRFWPQWRGSHGTGVASFGNPPVSWSEEENIAWINRDEISSWTSPFVIEHGGSAQVVTSATNRVRSYDVETGELLWEASGVSLNAIPTPVGAQGMVFVTSGFQDFVLHAVDFPAARGDITDSNAIVWSHDRDTPYVPSPLLYDDTLYLLKSHSGILSAIEAKTGKTHYIERLDGILNVFASPVAAAGRIYIPSREGSTAVVESGQEFKLVAVNELDDGFDASPVVVDDEIYLRGKRYLYRISSE